MNSEQHNAAFNLSAVVIPLLKGVIYEDSDSTLWGALLNLQASVRGYVAVLGLELVLDEAEGYAFLRARRTEDEDGVTEALPRLIPRQPLSYPVSLLLALLRRKLVEFDAGGGDTRLVLSKEEVVELIRVFLPEGSNEAKFVDQVDKYLSKVEDLGFIRRLKGQGVRFEVRRILKAFVDTEWLLEFDERLAAYRVYAQGGTSDA